MDLDELIKEYRKVESDLQSLSLSIEDPIRGESGVLYHLSQNNESLTSGELSHLLKLSTGRISIILKSLEQKQLITRSHDAMDKRYTSVSLTDKGKQFEKENEIYRNLRVKKIIQELGIDDATEYIRLRNKKKEILIEMKETSNS